MERQTSLDPLPQISEINMTPLMDLTFILLITFIITFPLIEQGIPLNLPKGDAPELQEGSRTISIDSAGTVYLDSVVVAPQELATAMNALGKTDPKTTVYVRADTAIQYGAVVEILKILHDANITKMALVTQSEGEDAER